MPESLVHASPSRHIVRRVTAAVVALAALMVLGGCRAYGGGYIGEPLPGDPVSVYDGEANFGFNFTCEMHRRAKRALIMGEITYHDSGASTVGGVEFPEVRLHGTVDPFFVESVSTCKQAAEMVAGLPVVKFEGTYRPQGNTPPVSGVGPDGRFIVQVFDQGQRGRPRGDFTGDSFAIELIGGAYNGYTRAGYIERGNIQVEG